MIILIMKNAVKHFKKLRSIAKILDTYGLFVANFNRYFGQFLNFISGNPGGGSTKMSRVIFSSIF